MRKRNIRVSVRLNEMEHRKLKKKAQSCRMKIDPFIRKLIMDQEVRAAPPELIPDLLYELSKIGTNINQIARNANTAKDIEADTIESVVQMQLAIWRKVKGL